MKKSKPRASRPAARKASAKASPKAQPKKRTAAPPKGARLAGKESGPALNARQMTTNGSFELDPRLFQMRTGRAIATSLKRSADQSNHIGTTPFHSAMSTLGALVSQVELVKARLEAAKKELRQLYGEGVEKTPGENTPVPPQEYGRRRRATKGGGSPAEPGNPADNRPRVRNKVI
jgi:hypothetical protein